MTMQSQKGGRLRFFYDIAVSGYTGRGFYSVDEVPKGQGVTHAFD